MPELGVGSVIQVCPWRWCATIALLLPRQPRGESGSQRDNMLSDRCQSVRNRTQRFRFGGGCAHRFRLACPAAALLPPARDLGRALQRRIRPGGSGRSASVHALCASVRRIPDWKRTMSHRVTTKRPRPFILFRVERSCGQCTTAYGFSWGAVRETPHRSALLIAGVATMMCAPRDMRPVSVVDQRGVIDMNRDRMNEIERDGK